MKKLASKGNIAKSLLIALAIFSIYFLVTFALGFRNNITSKASEIDNYRVIAQEFLGFNGPKGILILFQNNAEQRHGGGFIGTVGYIEIDKGKIKPQPARSVYDYDWGVGQEVDFTPSDGKKTTLRDSGQNLDWPTNAKRAKEIFENQSKRDVDSVLAITPEVLKYLLRKTGPIRLEKYDLTVNDANITETIQLEVESGVDKSLGNDPKTVISELANVLIKRLSDKKINELQSILFGLTDLVNQRQVSVYSPNYEISRAIRNLGLDGGLIKFESDYLMVSEYNNSADKSNSFIDRSIRRYINIASDGGIKVDIVISRKQTAPISLPYIDPNAPESVTFLINKNVSEIKVAIPSGSKIIAVEGDTQLNKVGREGNYDVYYFVSALDPLVKSDYTFSYELPYKLAGELLSYDSYIQLQNGGWPYDLTTEVIVPSNWNFVASNKPNVAVSKDRTYINNLKIDRDQLISLVFIEKK